MSRYNRAEYAKILALQQEVSRAEADYQRLRAAYLEVARNEPGHEVALAMIGADMDRAHARLQALIGLPKLPFTHEPSVVVRREAQRQTEEH
jgi:Na+-translocating ferredoxin:NAD+ oxidoreductase RnfC subunit